jgi:drug/metabolite transporter (DMT)-like permease
MLAPIIPIVATIFGWIFFDSRPNIYGWVWILLISIWVVLLFWKNTNEKNLSLTWILSAVGAYAMMWLWTSLDKIAMQEVSPFLYAPINQLIACGTLFILSYFLEDGTKISYFQKNWKGIVALWMTQWISYLSVMYAIYHAPNIWYAVALSNTHTIITAIYGIVVLKEKLTPRKLLIFLCMTIALISFTFA